MMPAAARASTHCRAPRARSHLGACSTPTAAPLRAPGARCVPHASLACLLPPRCRLRHVMPGPADVRCAGRNRVADVRTHAGPNHNLAPHTLRGPTCNPFRPRGCYARAVQSHPTSRRRHAGGAVLPPGTRSGRATQRAVPARVTAGPPPARLCGLAAAVTRSLACCAGAAPSPAQRMPGPRRDVAARLPHGSIPIASQQLAMPFQSTSTPAPFAPWPRASSRLRPPAAGR